ncbi:hypothetical protein EC991_003577 [Linnemannia zychae]|nr:hypothetical protein EC991_003577 [Linnemannia zychae]
MEDSSPPWEDSHVDTIEHSSSRGEVSQPSEREQSTCTICLNTYEDRAVLQSCHHEFCFCCILQCINLNLYLVHKPPQEFQCQELRTESFDDCTAHRNGDDVPGIVLRELYPSLLTNSPFLNVNEPLLRTGGTWAQTGYQAFNKSRQSHSGSFHIVSTDSFLGFGENSKL